MACDSPWLTVNCVAQTPCERVLVSTDDGAAMTDWELFGGGSDSSKPDCVLIARALAFVYGIRRDIF
jgi:hypothetical protein